MLPCMHSLSGTATSARVGRRTPATTVEHRIHIVTFPCIIAVGGGRPDKQPMCSLSISGRGLLSISHLCHCSHRSVHAVGPSMPSQGTNTGGTPKGRILHVTEPSTLFGNVYRCARRSDSTYSTQTPSPSVRCNAVGS